MNISFHYVRAALIGVAVGLGILFVTHVPINDTFFSFQPTASPTATPDRTSWRTYTNQKYGISLKYPASFQLVPGKSGALAEWQLYGVVNGIEIASVEIPSSFQIRTNFLGASLRIGLSTDSTAIHECLNPPTDLGYQDTYQQRTIGGKSFREFTRSDAAAGNFYEFTSYRAVNSLGCEVFEYAIHNTDIQNYPPSSGRKEFDHSAVTGMLDSILDTVTITK